jgi:hypothetical protein
LNVQKPCSENLKCRKPPVSDIAVGAPYEQNGVVYIYHGSADGIKHKSAQIIQAENIDPQIKGFGISLSKGVDIDENHYNGTCLHACRLSDDEVELNFNRETR